MFRQIVDVLKEVFWIKPSRKKSKAKPSKTIRKKTVKKKIAKKAVKKTPAKVIVKARAVKALKQAKIAAVDIDPNLQEIGVITHYFERIKVSVVKLTHGTVLIGDKLTIIGPKRKFVQKIWSMQIESEDVKVAKKGQLIGIKVDKQVGLGDKVYK